MFKVDLHTHSTASPDGGLSQADYRHMLEQGGLDAIAVTDHDSIAFAQQLYQELGDQIIIGEEISAREGEVIGLFLQTPVPAGLGALETARHIHDQGGLVYIPHPFETVRKGLPLATLENLAEQVDIVETHNGRAMFQNQAAQARAWATQHAKPGAASSDAHGRAGWGRAFSVLRERPTCANLVAQLTSATYQAGTVGLRGILYPKFNRLRKKISHA